MEHTTENESSPESEFRHFVRPQFVLDEDYNPENQSLAEAHQRVESMQLTYDHILGSMQQIIAPFSEKPFPSNYEKGQEQLSEEDKNRLETLNKITTPKSYPFLPIDPNNELYLDDLFHIPEPINGESQDRTFSNDPDDFKKRTPFVQSISLLQAFMMAKTHEDRMILADAMDALLREDFQLTPTKKQFQGEFSIPSFTDLVKLSERLNILRHDIGTPLTSIIGYTQYFFKRGGDFNDPRKVERLLNTLNPQFRRMQSILTVANEILEGKITPEPVEGNDLIKILNSHLIQPLKIGAEQNFHQEFDIQLNFNQEALQKATFVYNNIMLEELIPNLYQNIYRAYEKTDQLPHPPKIVIDIDATSLDLQLTLRTEGTSFPEEIAKAGKYTGISGHGGEGRAMKYYCDQLEALFGGNHKVRNTEAGAEQTFIFALP